MPAITDIYPFLEGYQEEVLVEKPQINQENNFSPVIFNISKNQNQNISELLATETPETGTDKIRKKSLILTKFNAEVQDDREQLLELRNESIIRGYDVLCAMFIEKGLFTDDIDFGRQYLELFGGLMSYVSEKDLAKYFSDNISIVRKKESDMIIGTYITTSDLTVGTSPSPQELISFGTSLGKLLTEQLICNPEMEGELKQKLLYSIMESQLAYCAYMCTSNLFRKQGIATLLKAVTFYEYLQKGVTKGLLDIFSINGVYRKIGENNEGENEYEQIHEFASPIRNVGSMNLNDKIIQYIGYVPIYKKVTDMIDDEFSSERTVRKISRSTGIKKSEIENYYVRINALYFLTDFEKSLEILKKKIDDKELLNKISISR